MDQPILSQHDWPMDIPQLQSIIKVKKQLEPSESYSIPFFQDYLLSHELPIVGTHSQGHTRGWVST